MTYKPPRRPQFFYTTAPLPCPYVSGRTERKVVTEITGPDADNLHDRLSRAGVRRSHNIAYAPVCPSFQLFQRYQQARHGDGDMATMSFYDYRAMIEDTPIETTITEFRGPGERLVGGCLTDRLGDGLSAVYSFFAPECEKQSLGTYAILWLIERARAQRLPYVYLGYWVPESRKMAYKARFRPCEILVQGAWRTLTDGETGQAPGMAADLVPETAG